MLSYQHAYHAGNAADVHKHAALAVAIDYLVQKPKPLSYIETHAGRGLYDLSGAEARRTGEAAQGVARVGSALPVDHPYTRALTAIRAAHGDTAYPGSPAIARALLRAEDSLHLAELHPAEHDALCRAVRGPNVRHHRQDGLALAHSLCPPEPRRGLMLIDPSYEVKDDYAAIPRAVAKLHRAWNVGVVMVWYPLLADPAHGAMLAALARIAPDGLRHEIRFPPARPGHRMVGSGLFVINPPFGLADALGALAPVFAALSGARA